MKNNTMYLKELKLPHDIKKLNIYECEQLCREIRHTILKTVLKSGGHLSSNLGTVELTVALHRVFNSPYDKFVWDVGHQAYTHKILTGRYDSFDTLRKEGGISGFMRPSESKHDAFISGHSSTSISAALGMAEAMRLNGDTNHHAVAIIGDGAFTGGLAYEGLNNAGKSNDNIIVILNHNDMSISKNVGALAKYLTNIRGSQGYLDTKKVVESILNKTPIIGQPVKRMILSSKSALKNVLYHSTMFEDLGFVYLGPVDGHDLCELEDTLRIARRIKRPVLIHVNTIKGKGFKLSENNPGAFHAVPSSGYSSSNPENMSGETFSDNFGRQLVELAAEDNRICAVTAAMKYGTGLQYFGAEYPERFFDVGIAEQHAVTFAGGLAKSGKIPVFAVYSSFLQRSYDQIIHDIAIDREHVVFAVDRAGIVGEDGETHQGLFDIQMFSGIPGMTVYSPSDFNEQILCLKKAVYETDGPAAVRYPRGKEPEQIHDFKTAADNYFYSGKNADCLAVSFGRICSNLCRALADESCAGADMLRLVKIIPIDDEVINICCKYDKIVFFEEGLKKNGIGESLMIRLIENGFKGTFRIYAIDGFVSHAPVERVLEKYRLDSRSMIEAINCLVNEN